MNVAQLIASGALLLLGCVSFVIPNVMPVDDPMPWYGLGVLTLAASVGACYWSIVRNKRV